MNASAAKPDFPLRAAGARRPEARVKTFPMRKRAPNGISSPIIRRAARLGISHGRFFPTLTGISQK